MIDKGKVAQAMWTTLTTAYGQGATTRVEVPVEDVVDIMLSITANVLANVSAADRERIQRDIGPKLDHMIGSVRERTNIILPSRPRDGLLLPH